jgi:predicted MFS family arabinose efflux permease
VSYKDILGKTVEKTRRGAITGLASSLSAVAVVAFAGLMLAGVLQSQTAVIIAIAIAAGLWIAAALLFSGMREKASEVDADSGGIDWSILRENPQLWRFIAARGFLVSTALAPPYFVLLSAEASLLQLDRLGALLLASAAAGLISSYVWGRFADYSSRQVLAVAGGVGALAMAAAAGFAALGWAEIGFVMPATLFVLMVAYQGVRQGRSTYLVDMAPEDQRSAYAAVANTVIGILLLAAGALGGLASIIGAVWALVLFAVLAVLGALTALTLNEVEGA